MAGRPPHRGGRGARVRVAQEGEHRLAHGPGRGPAGRLGQALAQVSAPPPSLVAPLVTAAAPVLFQWTPVAPTVAYRLHVQAQRRAIGAIGQHGTDTGYDYVHRGHLPPFRRRGRLPRGVTIRSAWCW